MEFKNKVKALLDQVFVEQPHLFLINLVISNDNKITVTIDGDTGVSLKDCIAVSRGIEHNLDREEEDFSLEVFSAGASSPLQFPRQYHQHIGRNLEVVANAETITGTLSQVNESGITLTWEEKEPKPNGKGKIKVNKTKEIPFSNIEKAVVLISF